MTGKSRRFLGGLLAVALLALTGACTSDGERTGSKGYVSGNGGVLEVPIAERGDPISYAGVDLINRPLAIEDSRGKPTVIVVWGAWCSACRKEAPELAGLAREYGDRAAFVGLNIRDASPIKAIAMQRRFDLPYPSLYEPEGRAMLAFEGLLTPRSIPGFVVLDAQGRPASAIPGALPSIGTLRTLIDDVLAESAGDPTTDG